MIRRARQPRRHSLTPPSRAAVACLSCRTAQALRAVVVALALCLLLRVGPEVDAVARLQELVDLAAGRPRVLPLLVMDLLLVRVSEKPAVATTSCWECHDLSFSKC